MTGRRDGEGRDGGGGRGQSGRNDEPTRVDRAIADLGEALDSVRPRISSDEAVELAVRGRRGERVASGRASGSRPRWIGWRPRWTPEPAWRWAIPAVAAVAIALWIGVRPGAVVVPDEAFRPELVATGEQRPAPFSVEAPSEGNVAVFGTSNDRIRVVWYY